MYAYPIFNGTQLKRCFVNIYINAVGDHEPGCKWSHRYDADLTITREVGYRINVKPKAVK